jgi:hypothetical protein
VIERSATVNYTGSVPQTLNVVAMSLHLLLRSLWSRHSVNLRRAAEGQRVRLGKLEAAEDS